MSINPTTTTSASVPHSAAVPAAAATVGGKLPHDGGTSETHNKTNTYTHSHSLLKQPSTTLKVTITITVTTTTVTTPKELPLPPESTTLLLTRPPTRESPRTLLLELETRSLERLIS